MNDSYDVLHTLLYKAYLDARRKKRVTQSQLRFEIDAERRLEKLYNELILRKWKSSPCIRFVVKYPVKREVFASEFADRVVLPIGDLTSQLFSNIYLNELDQYVKRELKVQHYGRYVDDFFLVSQYIIHK